MTTKQAQTAEALKGATTVTEAIALVAPLTVKQLRAVAQLLGLTLTRTRKADIAAEIVQGVIGFRLKFAAVEFGARGGRR